MPTPSAANLFNEPGCTVNRAKSDKQRKVGCSARTLTPGAAAKSLAAGRVVSEVVAGDGLQLESVDLGVGTGVDRAGHAGAEG